MLEFLITTSYFVVLLSFILIPVLIVRRLKRLKAKFLAFKCMIYVLLTCFILSVFSAFWTYYSSKILLRSYNAYEYNPDSGTEQVEFDNVEPKNIQKVKSLEQSIMGIGWPLKALFLFVFSILPVFLLTFITTEIAERFFLRNKKILYKDCDESP